MHHSRYVRLVAEVRELEGQLVDELHAIKANEIARISEHANRVVAKAYRLSGFL